MNVGRNDPCPCGSGRKYKKCCMRKDQERQAAATAVEAPPVGEYVPERPSAKPAARPARRGQVKAKVAAGPGPSAADVADKRRWRDYEKRDYEGRIRLFRDEVDEGTLDGDAAFEMLTDLYPEMVQLGQRDRFDELVGELRQRLPDAYAEEACYFVDRQIANAIALGRHDAIAPLAREMARAGKGNVDVMFRSIDRLMYHGRTGELLELFRSAWGWIQGNEADIVPWGIHEFADLAFGVEMGDYLQRAAEPTAADPGLLERLGRYVERPLDPDHVQLHLDLLRGVSEPSWRLEDVAPRRGGDVEEAEGFADEAPGDPAARRLAAAEAAPGSLHHLGLAFTGFAWRGEGVPFPRASLARRGLLGYLVEREEGRFDDRRSMLERMQHPGRKPPRARYDHPLCPDRATLDYQLARMLEFLAPRPYRAGALFELIPCWLAFLESRGLLDAEQRARTFEELRPLNRQLPGILERYADEPLVAEGVMAAWEEA